MRVRLTDDSGAVAIMTALLTLVLVGTAAFTTDFGIAYQSKRQIQTAADAAALVAAQRLAQVPGDCSVIAADAGAVSEAQDLADTYADENRPGQTRVADLEVRCSEASDGLAADSALVVTYTSTATTDTAFGGVFGVDSITATRVASASVQPATSSGVRPYGVCAAQLETFDPSNPALLRIDFPRNSGEDLEGCTTPSGNWYTLKCPEDSNNASVNLAEKTRDGCTDPVSIVSGQPDPPADADAVLEAACASGRDIDCLGGNPGNFPGPVFNAWFGLLGEVVIFPVFSGTSVVDPNGNNAKYPVQSMVAAKVCGYNFGRNANQNQWGISDDPACAGTAFTGTNSANFLYLLPATVFTSGTSGEALCSLGDTQGPCGNDSVRQTRLVR